MLIRQLLHDQGFTIPGARKRIRELDRHRVESEPDPKAAREVGLRSELLGVREQLEHMLMDLEDAAEEELEEPARTVRVQSVAPAAIAVPSASRPRT